MIDYIKYMRNLIGNKPLLICGAGIIVFDDNNRVLMQQRKDNNCWGFPGGIMELGERIEDTAVREVFEEAGLTITDLKIFGVFSGKDLHYIYPNGDEVYILDTLFISKNYTGKIVVQENECKDAKFFDIDNLPENISPPAKTSVKELIRRHKDRSLYELLED